jgi:hypothetical protein
MRNKPRIMLALHHRDALSTKGRRERFGLVALHSPILIVPKSPEVSTVETLTASSTMRRND